MPSSLPPYAQGTVGIPALQVGRSRLRTTHKSHTPGRAEAGLKPRPPDDRSRLLTTAWEGKKGISVKGPSKGQLAEPSARRKGKGISPRGGEGRLPAGRQVWELSISYLPSEASGAHESGLVGPHHSQGPAEGGSVCEHQGGSPPSGPSPQPAGEPTGTSVRRPPLLFLGGTIGVPPPASREPREP